MLLILKMVVAIAESWLVKRDLASWRFPFTMYKITILIDISANYI